MDSIFDSTARDNLIAGPFPMTTTGVTLAASQTLTRGTVLGKITVVAGTAAAGGGNTGDGTLTGFALSATGGPPVVGTYKATCISEVANLGYFNVTNPSGATIGIATVGTAFTAGGITFTINDGTEDFNMGDYFNLPVTAGSGYYKKLDVASTDGSQVFMGILLEAVTTGGGEYFEAPMALTGEFHSQQLALGGSTTVADIVDAAAAKNCYIRTTYAGMNVYGG